MLDVAVGIFDERALNSAAARVRHGDGDLLRFESARSYGVFDDGREGFCGGLCDGILLDVSHVFVETPRKSCKAWA